VSGQGVREMLYRVRQLLEELPSPEPLEELPVIRPEEDEAFAISREMTEDGEAWRVSGDKIERVAAMTYWEFSEAVARFQRILKAMGITDALTEAGVQPGDLVIIGDEVLEWSD
jgi:GTP-binding protein